MDRHSAFALVFCDDYSEPQIASDGGIGIARSSDGVSTIISNSGPLHVLYGGLHANKWLKMTPRYISTDFLQVNNPSRTSGMERPVAVSACLHLFTIQTSRQKTSICNTNFEASPSRVQEQPDADPPAPPPPLQSRTDDFMDVPIIYATATL